MRIEGIPAPGAYFYNFLTKRRRNLDRLIAREVASRMERGKVLDVGTGPGFIPIEVAKMNPSLEVWGIDISKTMIKLARKNAEKAGVENVKFEVMSAYNLKFPAEHFDLVMSFGALHHFHDPLKVFNEIYRVLKPGKEAWICDLITDVDGRELKKFLKDVGLPYFPWGIAFRLHGLKYREWNGRIPEIAKNSAFDDYVMENRRALMKLILKKHTVNMNLP